MDIGKIVLTGIIATIFTLVIKKAEPSISLIVSLATCLLIFLMIVPNLTLVIDMVGNFNRYIDSTNLYIDIILKIIGIAYISEFATQLCNDSGEKAIGSKIELGGKVLIMAQSIPIINEILVTVIRILPK